MVNPALPGTVLSVNQATGYASQHYLVPVSSKDKLGGCGRKRAFSVKMGNDGGGGTDSPGRVASRRIVSVSASVIFPCTV